MIVLIFGRCGGDEPKRCDGWLIVAYYYVNMHKYYLLVCVILCVLLRKVTSTVIRAFLNGTLFYITLTLNNDEIIV